MADWVNVIMALGGIGGLATILSYPYLKKQAEANTAELITKAAGNLIGPISTELTDIRGLYEKLQRNYEKLERSHAKLQSDFDDEKQDRAHSEERLNSRITRLRNVVEALTKQLTDLGHEPVAKYEDDNGRD